MNSLKKGINRKIANGVRNLKYKCEFKTKILSKIHISHPIISRSFQPPPSRIGNVDYERPPRLGVKDEASKVKCEISGFD